MNTRRHRVNALIAGALVAASFVTVHLITAQERYGHANRSIVAPRQELVKSVINEAYAKFKNDTAGKNADYIPYLAKVDSNLFAIAVVTTDNQSYMVGDVGYSFSIQ